VASQLFSRAQSSQAQCGGRLRLCYCQWVWCHRPSLQCECHHLPCHVLPALLLSPRAYDHKVEIPPLLKCQVKGKSVTTLEKNWSLALGPLTYNLQFFFSLPGLIWMPAGFCENLFSAALPNLMYRYERTISPFKLSLWRVRRNQRDMHRWFFLSILKGAPMSRPRSSSSLFMLRDDEPPLSQTCCLMCSSLIVH
jgi:hypothetical protein